jgi:MOSC domain-containing protein
MEQLGTVAALYRYPVKALRGETLQRAEVEAGGFAGDRGNALIVRSRDHARTGKTYRGKENRKLHTVATIDGAADLARGAGLTVEHVDEQPHYFDAEPVSIVFDTWVRDLEALASRGVDPLQFRPNIVAAAAPDFSIAEPEMIGMRISVGDVVFDVVSSITRCVTISYDVATGEADPALQRTIVQERDNKMGIYCRVVTPGIIEAGAPIRRI